MPFTVVDEGDVAATRTSLWTSGKSLTALKKQKWMTVHTGDENKVTEVVLPGKAQTERHLGYPPSDKISLCWLSLCLSSYLSGHFQLSCRGLNIFDSQFDRLGPLEALSSLQ